MKPYEMIDHTADIGIRVRGRSLAELFEKAAFAVFDTLADLENVTEHLHKEIELTGMDLPELMVNWLNDLLFLWETQLVLYKRFQVRELSDTALWAEAWGELYDEERHPLLSSIKAATYHKIRIEEQGGAWIAEIILDA